ncbi:hypothetical protein NG819_15860 [Pseudarthrobacter sp. Fe7]|nr:hypothetical protein NG819_15860 [Pseudarthrobacter sp. Fe7]
MSTQALTSLGCLVQLKEADLARAGESGRSDVADLVDQVLERIRCHLEASIRCTRRSRETG